MAKIKIASYSATTFLYGGLALEKGAYLLKFITKADPDDTTGLFVTSGQTATKLILVPKEDAQAYANSTKLSLPTSNALPYTSFLDSTGTAYASFDLCVKDILSIIATPSNASVSDLISDKNSVTQATSKTTTVVSNALNTIITTVALTDALDTQFSFTFTNSKISSTTNVIPTIDMNGGTGWANVAVTRGSGTATITVRNTGTASFNSAIKIGLIVV